MTEPERRDRTLSRVRTTTAVTGIGAVLVGGALAGWLGHEATEKSSTDSSTSTDSGSSSSTDSGSSSSTDSGSDGGLSGSSTLPESGSSDSDQPGITSGGS